MLPTSKRNFFSQKFCTSCTFSHKHIRQEKDEAALNPTRLLTHSPVTHCWTLCSHAAGDRVNLSWLVGIGKPGMPLPCSDATVFAMHDGFTKKCCPQVCE